MKNRSHKLSHWRNFENPSDSLEQFFRINIPIYESLATDSLVPENQGLLNKEKTALKLIGISPGKEGM